MNSRQKSLIAIVSKQHLELESLRTENEKLKSENKELKNMFNGSIKKYEPEGEKK